MEAQESMGKPQWRATALAVAAAVLLGVPASDANALALGRVTVQSALGEPLRADIDVPDINAEEVSSLRAALASPDAFKAAGFDYNSALQNITITLMKRPDGRYFLQLTTRSPVNDPFIDLIIEANWSSGRIVRDYTMLFDPPNLRQGAPLAAQVSPVAPPASTQARTTAPRAAPGTTGSRTPSSSRNAATSRAPAAQPSAGARPPSGESKQVTVQAGDTAGKIAAANKPPSVSLDQMLVAMLRSNPDAFVGGNVNRLRAGAVLDVPVGESAGLVPSDEASQTIVAQSRDFNEFRRRLAEGLPTTRIAPADRQSSGKVQARVEEKKPSAAAPDKLTLSKGAVQGKGAAEEIARDRAAKDAAARVAELNKNISDLNKLSTGTPGAKTAASTPNVALTVPVGAASAPKAGASVAATATPKPAAVPVPPPVVAAASKPAAAPATTAPPAPATTAPAPSAAASVATPVLAAAPAPAAAMALPASSTVAPSTSAAAASAPAAAASSVATPQAAASAAAVPAMAAASAKPASATRPAAALAPRETSFVDDLLDNPFLLATIGAAVALLAGFGFYRVQQRKKSTQVDSSFLESRLQPDSFFGASGGQRIDTNEGNPTGSSMVYSPSQLDAAGDVDPVAEADVYLAYGRDLQAEEILKEAMRTTPQRVAVHSKLLEIYAKRRDAKAFELVATEAYSLTHGAGPEWEHICELGQELDPANSLYRPGGQPSEGAAAMAADATGKFGATTATQPMAAPASSAPDVDLDLDFSIGDDEPAAPASQPTLALNVPPAAAPAPMPSLDMDFGSATVALDPPAPAPSQPEPARLDAPDLMLPGNSLNFDLEPPPSAAAPAAQAAAAPAASAPAAADPGMIEFDLGALSLDLDAPAKDAGTSATGPDTESPTTAGTPLGAEFDDSSSDPLATKLALAQEFNAIGDPDGARSLAQEVIAEASGDLKNKAQRFLAEIG
jgi:pilus assembly protein FimV